MKCIRHIESGSMCQYSDNAAAALAEDDAFEYASKADWKAGGRVRSTVLHHAPNSIHPRKGWANREKKGRWGR